MRAALATSGRLEVPSLEEQALYHNLCILGIVNPNLRQEGIELSRTTFRRSNNKALEYVLYRLYIIIEGRARAQKDFKGMLPVLDKVQQAPFYQRIGDWMMELKKSGRLEPSVILPVSALKTNTSSRLVILLLELSTVALQQEAEVTCQGTIHSAYLPSLGSSAVTAAAGGVWSGLLDDALVPAEVRLAVSVTRAKQACSDFLVSAATATSVCDAMEQRSLAFKRRYYELQAEIRQQEVARAEFPEGAQCADQPSSSPLPSSSPATSSGATAATTVSASTSDPASQTTSGGAGSSAGTLLNCGLGMANGSAALQQPQRQQPLQSSTSRWGLSLLPGARPNPDSLATLSSLLAGLDEHLRVHKELSEALMTDGDAADLDGADGAAAAGRLRAGGFGQPPPQQVLHPYQIDGRVLAAEVLAAAAGGADAAVGPRGGGSGSGGTGLEQQSQRRQQKNMLMPYGPDNIAKAFMSFASLLSSLAPHVTQLAMAGENAGPPPLLQPPSHPSGHAAHVAHQLQVHGNTSRQIAQLSRKVQEQSVAYGPVLRVLRLESSRGISQRSLELSGHDCCLDDDVLDMSGPHLALPAPASTSAPAAAALTQPPSLLSLRRVNPNAPFPSMCSPRPQAPAAGLQPSSGQGAGAPTITAPSSGAPSIVMGSPCPSSTSMGIGMSVCMSAAATVTTTAGACMASGSSACPSAGTAAPTAKAALTTSTTAAPAPMEDGLARIHARLRSLNLAAASQPTAAGAVAVTNVPAAGGGSAVAPVTATYARLTSGIASANAAMASALFSPPANLHGSGASPMAISGAARPPLSPTVHAASFELPSAYDTRPAQAVAGSTVSPLRGAMWQQQQSPLGSLEAGMLMMQKQQQATRELDGREAAAGATAAAGNADADISGSGGAPVWPSMPWLGGMAAAPSAATGCAATVATSSTSQAWVAAGIGRHPAWMPQQQQQQNALPDSVPSRRRALDGVFLQQQLQQQQQPSSVHSAGSSLTEQPANHSRSSGSSGGDASDSSAAMQRSRSDAVVPVAMAAAAESLQPGGHQVADRAGSGGGGNPAGAMPVAGWGAVTGTLAGGGGAGANPQAAGELGPCLAATTSGGPVASGERRRVDLCSLLDDDDDDGGHGLSGSHQRLEAVCPAAEVGPPLMGVSPQSSFEAFHPLGAGGGSGSGAAHGALHVADVDDDFGILAAEGELVSQALMYGGAVAGSLPSNSPRGAVASAGGPAGVLFGAPLAEVSSSGWGSCGGGLSTTDLGDRESDGDGRTTVAAGKAAVSYGGSTAPQCGAGVGSMMQDTDSGDDVIMADNDKDVASVLSPLGFGGKGSGSLSMSLLGAGVGTGTGVGVMTGGRQGHKGSSLFDAFGVLLSPQQPPQQHQVPTGNNNAFGRLQQQQPPQNVAGPTAPALSLPSQQPQAAPAVIGGFGAEILALKARMQAAMTKQ